MHSLIKLVLNAIAILISAYLVPGVMVSSFLTALAVAVVIGLLNIFIKPILLILTLPINILTLGLFTIVINVLILLLASAIVPGFKFDSFISTLLFGLVLSLVSAFLSWLA